MKIIALIIAGGRGIRMKSSGNETPKQFLNVNNKPVIAYTLEVFQSYSEINEIEVVCLDGWQDYVKQIAKKYHITKLKSVVKGGSCGQESIKNGLDSISKRHNDKNDIVLIHDAVRPNVSHSIISDNIAVCRTYGNAITVIPSNSVMLVSKDDHQLVSEFPRSQLKATQTPQAFFLKDILAAHRKAKKVGITNSLASCSLYVQLNIPLYMSKGSETNIKLTTPDDMEIFKALLKTKNKL